MNFREKKKTTKLKDIADYEVNLKLHYEAMQNELNTLIRNTLPNQQNMLKTLMWLNVIFLGASLQLKNFNYSFFLLILSVSIALGLSFYAMIMGKDILYGNSQRRGLMREIKDGEWAKVDGIYWMMFAVQRAIRYNGLIVIRKSKILKCIVYITFVSLLFLVLCFVTNTNKEVTWLQENPLHQLLHQDQVQVAKEEQ